MNVYLKLLFLYALNIVLFCVYLLLLPLILLRQLLYRFYYAVVLYRLSCRISLHSESVKNSGERKKLVSFVRVLKYVFRL